LHKFYAQQNMQCSVTSQHCLTATYSCELMLNRGRLCF